MLNLKATNLARLLLHSNWKTGALTVLQKCFLPNVLP